MNLSLAAPGATGANAVFTTLAIFAKDRQENGVFLMANVLING
jgi:hypothetical protein